MSGSRGRKTPSYPPDYPRFSSPRWPSQQQQQQQFYSPSGGRGWSNGNVRNWHPGFDGWQNTPSSIQAWPNHQYSHGGHARGKSYRYDQYQQGYPNSYNNSSVHFTEQNQPHLNATSMNELAVPSLIGSRESFNQSAPSSSRQQSSVKKSSVSYPGKDSIGVTPAGNLKSTKATISANQTKGHSSTSKPSSVSKVMGEKQLDGSHSSITKGAVEKPGLQSTSSDSFMPPNDDLLNKVKASLKMFSATKDQGAPSSPNQSTAPSSSSPQRPRESRIPTAENLLGSPSTSNSSKQPIRTSAHRRVSQSSTSSTSASTEGSNALDGIGFVQRTSSESTMTTDQVKI